MKILTSLLPELFEKVTLMEFGILLFGCTAIWFVGRRESWRRWGYIFGLCAQPFWFVMLYRDQKYLVLALSALYSYSWAQGVWCYWVKPDAASDYFRRVKTLALQRGIGEKEMIAEILREYFDRHPTTNQTTDHLTEVGSTDLRHVKTRFR